VRSVELSEIAIEWFKLDWRVTVQVAGAGGVVTVGVVVVTGVVVVVTVTGGVVVATAGVVVVVVVVDVGAVEEDVSVVEPLVPALPVEAEVGFVGAVAEAVCNDDPAEDDWSAEPGVVNVVDAAP
jgi:hypothetical protein